MPRYEVRERRTFTRTIIIDAENETAAAHLDGTHIQEEDDYSTADETLSVTQVPNDHELNP